MKMTFLPIGILLVSWLTPVTASELARKKLIEVGWDMPDTAFLRQHWQEMERTAPFDGLNFCVTAANPEGGRAESLKIWDGKPWQRTWFTNCITDLKSCRFAKFTDNFLRIDATPGTMDWADDQAWGNLAEKLAICAWIAREGGGRGLCLDLERYGVKSFKFDPASGRSFAEASGLARKRGAELMRAIAREYPRQTLFALNARKGRSVSHAIRTANSPGRARAGRRESR